MKRAIIKESLPQAQIKYNHTIFLYEYRICDAIAMDLFRIVMNCIEVSEYYSFSNDHLLYMIKILDSIKRFFEKNSVYKGGYFYRNFPGESAPGISDIVYQIRLNLPYIEWINWDNANISYIESCDFHFIIQGIEIDDYIPSKNSFNLILNLSKTLQQKNIRYLV